MALDTARRLRNRHLLAADLLALPACAVAAFALHYGAGFFGAAGARLMLALLLVAVPVQAFALVRLGLYTRLWRYAGQSDLELLCVAGTVSGAVAVLAGATVPRLVLGPAGVIPGSVLVLYALLAAVTMAVPRLLVRRAGRRTWGRRRADAGIRRVLIAGAGSAGAAVVRELAQHPEADLVPAAFVDDDPIKRGRHLHGIPVAGGLDDIPALARRLLVDEVIVAMPSSSGAVTRRVMEAAVRAGLPARTVPGLYELVSGRKSVSALRNVEIADLLRRDSITTDLGQVRTLAHGKTVLVTGAGGSIGSELCRQVATLGPKRLVVLGRGENSVFELLQDLAVSHPGVQVEPVIADIRDRVRLERVFASVRPDTVFHAAAHKHVPLMEQNVAEAILNNVLGTQVVAELSSRHGCERFVLISSDKAVRPSSVMGATKRLAEGVLQRVAVGSRCRFMAVRFGNVLGSRGSVIPTFLRQIQQGGPVTITHPEMRRYFMTIPEAVQLVLQAGAMGDGGEVFVLDMGDPVRVLDLARDLIRLSGLTEGQDVDIRFSGMRPGEKLYEELFFNHENASPTDHPKVLRARNAALDLRGPMSIEALIALAARNAPSDELRRGIKGLVPEYTGLTGVAKEDRPRHEALTAARAQVGAADLAHAR